MLPAAAQRQRSALQYMVSRHWASLRESAEFPTSVKEVVTLLGNSVEGSSLPGFFAAKYYRNYFYRKKCLESTTLGTPT